MWSETELVGDRQGPWSPPTSLKKKKKELKYIYIYIYITGPIPKGMILVPLVRFLAHSKYTLVPPHSKLVLSLYVVRRKLGLCVDLLGS
jgi:hypothetical protein